MSWIATSPEMKTSVLATKEALAGNMVPIAKVEPMRLSAARGRTTNG